MAKKAAKLEPKLIEHEIICSDGDGCRMPAPCHSSTTVGIMMLIGKLKTEEQREHARRTMRFFRVYHDGMLVREWDERDQKYNLELD